MKAIWDKSKSDRVDIAVATAKIRAELSNTENVFDFDSSDVDKAQKFIEKHYEAICNAYKNNDFNSLYKLK